ESRNNVNLIVLILAIEKVRFRGKCSIYLSFRSHQNNFARKNLPSLLKKVPPYIDNLRGTSIKSSPFNCSLILFLESLRCSHCSSPVCLKPILPLRINSF